MTWKLIGTNFILYDHIILFTFNCQWLHSRHTNTQTYCADAAASSGLNSTDNSSQTPSHCRWAQKLAQTVPFDQTPPDRQKLGKSRESEKGKYIKPF